MEFNIRTASYYGNGIWGNKEKIKELKNTQREIETINDLKKLSEETDSQLIIDFNMMTIMIYDTCME